MLSYPKDLDHGSGLSIKTGKEIHVLEGIPYMGDFPKGKGSSIVSGKQDYFLIFVGSIALLFGADENLPSLGLYSTARHIQRCAPYPFCHLTKAQIECPECLFWYLDAHLVGSHPSEIYLGDIGLFKEFVSYLLCHLAQCLFPHVAVDHHRDDLTPIHKLRDHWLLCIFRKGHYPVYLILDVLEHDIWIGTVLYDS